MISRAQLLSFGVSAKAIRHRIERGRLVVVHPGVYQVGQRPLGRDGRLVAAILAAGDGAILSHESAAAVWRIRKGGTDPIHISVPDDRRIRLEGIRPHRRNPMPPATTLGPLPLSQPLFTLIDLAASLPPDPLEAAINEADKSGLIDWESAAAAIEDAELPRYPGLGKLRRVFHRFTRTDSNLERRFLALVRKARLPLPATQEHRGRGRIDFHWPDLNLVVETDGLTYHRTPIQQLEDRRRDQEHAAAGRTQLRFANLQIRAAPDEVVQTLRSVIKRLGEQR